jgi:hypothetical protein
VKRDINSKYMIEKRKTTEWLRKGIETCKVVYVVSRPYCSPSNIWTYETMEKYDASITIHTFETVNCEIRPVHGSHKYHLEHKTVSKNDDGKITSRGSSSYSAEVVFFDFGEAVRYVFERRQVYEFSLRGARAVLHDRDLNFESLTSQSRDIIREWLQMSLEDCPFVYRVEFCNPSPTKPNEAWVRACSRIYTYSSHNCKVVKTHPFYLLCCEEEGTTPYYTHGKDIFFTLAEAKEVLEQKIGEVAVLEITRSV